MEKPNGPIEVEDAIQAARMVVWRIDSMSDEERELFDEWAKTSPVANAVEDLIKGVRNGTLTPVESEMRIAGIRYERWAEE